MEVWLGIDPSTLLEPGNMGSAQISRRVLTCVEFQLALCANAPHTLRGKFFKIFTEHPLLENVYKASSCMVTLLHVVPHAHVALLLLHPPQEFTTHVERI